MKHISHCPSNITEFHKNILIKLKTERQSHQIEKLIVNLFRVFFLYLFSSKNRDINENMIKLTNLAYLHAHVDLELQTRMQKRIR